MRHSLFSSSTSRSTDDLEKLYRLQVEEMVDYALFLMSPDGIIITWNAGVRTVLGYEPEDFIGQHFEVLFTPDDRSVNMHEREMSTAAEKGRATDVRWHVQKSGGWVFVDGILNAVRDEAGALIGFSKIMRDATERHRAQVALKESEERFRSAFAHAATGVALLDLTGRFVQVNETFSTITGYTHNDLVGRDMLDITQPDDRPRVFGQFEQMLEGRIPAFIIEQRYIHKFGWDVWAQNSFSLSRNSHGEPASIMAITEDITERKQAVEALRASEDFTRKIIENSPDCIKVLDLGGRIISINDAGCRQMDIADPADCLNKPWSDWLDPQHKPALNRCIESALRGHKESFECYCPTLKGKPKWWDITITPILDAHGKPTRLLTVSRDVTERKQFLETLQRSNEELAGFAHVVSHDLQAPLRTIRSYTQLLTRRYAALLDQSGEEFVQYILEGTETMDRLIRDLLRYAEFGQDREEWRPVNLCDLLQKAVAALEAAVNENSAKVIHEQLPVVKGNGLQLQQVFQNLIGNSIKYRSAEPPEISVSAVRDGKQWVISVTDNGEGILPEYHERIFAPMKRLHGNDRPGTGLGLAVCQKIIERHGGRLWVESELGLGSTFRFTLPAS